MAHTDGQRKPDLVTLTNIFWFRISITQDALLACPGGAVA